MLSLRKTMSIALLFILSLNFFCAFVGEQSRDWKVFPEITDEVPEEDVIDDLEFRGTRQGSGNIDLIGWVPFGNVWDVWVEGDYAYVAIDHNLLILDITIKSNPTIVSTYETQDHIYAVQVLGDYAYLANFAEGLTIVNVADPSSPTLEGSLTDGIGWVSDVHVYGSYAYVTDNIALNTIDISDPGNPSLNDSFNILSANSVFVSHPYAYVTSPYSGIPGQEGLWVINVTHPDTLTELGHNESVTNAYDVCVSGEYAYVANISGGLRIFDISNTSNPIEVGFNDTLGFAVGVDVVGPIAYVADSFDGVKVLDVDLPTNPFEIGNYTQIYAQGIQVLGSYAYVASAQEGFFILDVSNPGNPQEEGSYKTLGPPLDVFVSDSEAYIATGNGGLDIVDVSDPSDPQRLGHYADPDYARSVHVEGNYAYIADANYGLMVANVGNPSNPSEVGELTYPNAMDVFVMDSYAYLVDGDEGLKVINIDTPSSPTEEGTYSDFIGTGVHVSGSFAYMAASYPDGLRIINVSTPSDPTEEGFYDGIEAFDVFVSGQYAYVTGFDHGLTILDISNASNPTFVGNLDTLTDPYRIFVSWRYAYVADSENGLRMIDVGDPENPTEIGYYVHPGDAIGVFAEDRYVYVAGDDGLFVFDVIDALDKTPPQTTLTYPLDDTTDVNLDIDIEITFNEAMDKTTTEQAFSITPNVAGNLSWLGNKLIFTTSQNLSEGTTYQVTISSDARDLAGNTLDGNENGVEDGSPSDDFSFDFTTLLIPPVVESVSPQHDSRNVPTDTSIVINFSKRMEKEPTKNAFSYTDGTAVNGLVTWSNDDKTMTFSSFTKLDFEKTYTVTIAHTAEDTDGGSLDGDEDGIEGEDPEDDYSWSFTIIPVPPQVQTVTPRDRETNVPTDASIVVRFTKAMNQTSVEDAFNYTYEGSNLSWGAFWGFVSWSADSKAMTFEPLFYLGHDREYTVTIAAAAQDTGGSTLDGDRDKVPEGSPTDDYIWTFTTIKSPPVVESVSPGNNTKNVKKDADIVITFDRPMNRFSTQKALSYSYDGKTEEFGISDGEPTWTDGDKTLIFDPDFDFEEGKTYSVTIEDTATDEDGIQFEGFSWEFEIKENSPPQLVAGAVDPEMGTTSEAFLLSVVYSDEDGDPPTRIKVVIDGVAQTLRPSDPTNKDYIGGKMYQFSIVLDKGEYSFYFEASDEKHDVRYPEGSGEYTFTVIEAEDDGEKLFGIFEEEYLGMPTMICGPIGLIIIIAIIISVIVVAKRKRRAAREETTFQTFDSFQPFEEPGEEQFSFMPMEEEGMMSFAAFEEPASLADAKPVVIQCPECEQHLKVRAVIRPFTFPCKCGKKLVLR